VIGGQKQCRLESANPHPAATQGHPARLGAVGRTEMPKAPVPAAKAALNEARLGFEGLHAVTTHNLFAVNDLWFASQTGSRWTG
jgi:hypothetical protein